MMPRTARLIFTGYSHHLIQRGKKAHRGLFRVRLDDDRVTEIFKATNGNHSFGSARFENDIERMFGRRA